MILKSIIMLSSFVTFALPILQGYALFAPPAEFFTAVVFYFYLVSTVAFPPPPPSSVNETMKTMLIQNLGWERDKKGPSGSDELL